MMQNNPLTFLKIRATVGSYIPKGAAPASERPRHGAKGGFVFGPIWSELPGYREVPGAPFGRVHSLGPFSMPGNRNVQTQKEVTT